MANDALRMLGKPNCPIKNETLNPQRNLLHVRGKASGTACKTEPALCRILQHEHDLLAKFPFRLTLLQQQ